MKVKVKVKNPLFQTVLLLSHLFQVNLRCRNNHRVHRPPNPRNPPNPPNPPNPKVNQQKYQRKRSRGSRHRTQIPCFVFESGIAESPRRLIIKWVCDALFSKT